MNDKDYVLPLPAHTSRRNPVFFTARSLAQFGHHFLATPHVEMDEETVRLRRLDGNVYFYVGLHRSLWETSGVQVPLLYAGLPLPYVGMGDNLVKGRLFTALSKRVGTFVIHRPQTRRETLVSARKLRNDILGYLAHGLDVLVFPEGTRKCVASHGVYGDFFATAFEPLLDYERNKDAICAANPGVSPRQIYIVPFNVDYSRVREAHELVARDAARPQTLQVTDSLSMICHLRDIYVTYDRPLPVADCLAYDRKQLAVECRRRCMSLVKILPINVVCLAMLRLDSSSFSAAALEAGVIDTVRELLPQRDRFRLFGADDPPGAIVSRARHKLLAFERFEPEKQALYRLYAAYVRHYLPPGTAPLQSCCGDS